MLGIDIVVVSRISALKTKFGDKFLARFLCEDEIKLIKSDASLAGFYATKEAVAKALGVGIGQEFSFLDVKIYKDKNGAPKLKFKDEILAKFKINKADLSISHDGGFAIAAVILE